MLGSRRHDPLCALTELDGIELGRREVAATVGLDSGAHFCDTEALARRAHGHSPSVRARRPRDQELGFTIPAAEEVEARGWRVFEEQSEEVQAGRIDRYRRAGMGGSGVEEDLAKRARRERETPTG